MPRFAPLFCWSKTQCLSAPRRKRPRWERSEVGPESQHTYDDVYSARILRNVCICWFPEIGVPPNHPFLDGIFPYEPSIRGYPHLWKPPYYILWVCCLSWQIILHAVVSFRLGADKWDASGALFFAAASGPRSSIDHPPGTHGAFVKSG